MNKLAQAAGLMTARFIVVVLFMTGAVLMIKVVSWLCGTPVDAELLWFILGIFSNIVWEKMEEE